VKPSGTHERPTRSASLSTSQIEDLPTEAKAEPVRCQVRSGTDSPCPRPASVEIIGVQSCEQCAREQQAYFAICENTQTPRGDARMTSGWHEGAFFGYVGEPSQCLRRGR
jgi:hypothetical protein